jgi:hypothetical protein
MLRFGNIVPGVYAPLLAKNSKMEPSFFGWREGECQAEFSLRRTGWSAYSSAGSIRTSKGDEPSGL